MKSKIFEGSITDVERKLDEFINSGINIIHIDHKMTFDKKSNSIYSVLIIYDDNNSMGLNTCSPRSGSWPQSGGEGGHTHIL